MSQFIEFDAFDPDAYLNYESPMQIENKNKIIKIFISVFVLLIIAIIIYKSFESKK